MPASERKQLDLPLQPNEAFGRVVRHWRKEEAGLTQEQLAASVGLRQSYVSDIERGKRNPTLQVVWVLAQGLGCSPSELLSDVERLITSAEQNDVR